MWRDGWVAGAPHHAYDTVADESRFWDKEMPDAGLFIALQVWNFWSEQLWTVLYQLRQRKAPAAVQLGKVSLEMFHKS